MRRRSRWAFVGLPALLLFVSCTTNPVTVSNFDADHPPPDPNLAIALSFIPGATQVANGEYLEGAALGGVFAGSVAALIVASAPDWNSYMSKQGNDTLVGLGVAGITGGLLYSVIDAIATTAQRHAQYSAILADPRVLSGLVELEKRDSAPLYAIRYASYGPVPSGTLRLRNLGATKLRQVEVYAEGSYLASTDQPVARVAELAARSEVDVPLALRFTPSVAALTEDRTIPLKLTASFRLAGQDQRRSTVGQVVLLSRNAVDWNDVAAIASYIQPEDPPIKDLAREIDNRVVELAGSAGGTPRAPSDWLRVLFAVLNARGLAWFPDPLTPFIETSQAKDLPDYLQLPRETLRFLGGDADEIAILLSSICEAAGLETSILFRPGMILTAVRLGPGSPFSKNLRSLGGESAREWVVIDPARMPADLRTLMEAGAQQFDRTGFAGLQAVRIRSAWGAFPPAVLPDTEWRAPVPSLQELMLDVGSQ